MVGWGRESEKAYTVKLNNWIIWVHRKQVMIVCSFNYPTGLKIFKMKELETKVAHLHVHKGTYMTICSCEELKIAQMANHICVG